MGEPTEITDAEPTQLDQIRRWEAGTYYPEHDTFSFGHGFGTAITEHVDSLVAALRSTREQLRDLAEKSRLTDIEDACDCIEWGDDDEALRCPGTCAACFAGEAWRAAYHAALAHPTTEEPTHG